MLGASTPKRRFLCAHGATSHLRRGRGGAVLGHRGTFGPAALRAVALQRPGARGRTTSAQKVDRGGGEMLGGTFCTCQDGTGLHNLKVPINSFG